MIAVSSLLRRVVYPAMSRASLFGPRIGAGEVCVLTYHGVMPGGWASGVSPIEGALVSADQFRHHLQFLKSRYHLISPELFYGCLKHGESFPPRAVLLTCDDGLLNVLTDMVPILLEEGARCLFFVSGGSLEDAVNWLWYEELYLMLDDAPRGASVAVGGNVVRKESWTAKDLAAVWSSLVEECSAKNPDDRKIALLSWRQEWQLPENWRVSKDIEAGPRYHLLNRGELPQLVAQGMTVGAHSLSHPLLTKMPTELAEQEIRECKTRLESYLRQEVWALAYPFGHEESAGVREMSMAERAGYTCAFLNCGGGLVRSTSPRFALPRAHVTGQMNLAELEAHLSGFHDALQKRFRGVASKLSGHEHRT